MRTLVRGDAHARRAYLGTIVPSVYRFGVLVAAVALAFRPSLDALASQVAAGSPLDYLAAVPAWCGTIAWGQRNRIRRGVDIHDRQLDWLVAASVAVLSSVALASAQRRLGDVALLWHVDLLAMVCWIWACSVVLFGVRATMALWPMWAFALLCWPAPYLLGYAALGGGPAGGAWMTVSLASFASLLAPDGHRRRLVAAALTAIVGGGACQLLVGHWSGSPAALMALAPLLSLIAANRLMVGATAPRACAHAGAGAQIGDRPRSLFRVASLVAAGSLVAVTIRAPYTDVASAAPGPSVGRPSLGPGWAVTDDQRYPWASAFYGSAATLRRYRFATAGGASRATVDVLTNVRPDALVPTVFYGGAAGLELGEVKLPDGRVGELARSDPDSELDAAAGGWVSVSWLSSTVADGCCQEVTVFVTPAAGSAAPAIVRPSVATALIRPANLLLRGEVGGSPRTQPAEVAAAERLAGLVIEHAAARP